MLDLQQDRTATETLSVSLSFDPSPPFFDGLNDRGQSGSTLHPGYVDDHPIRCIPTQLGPVHGTITVRANNCPVVVISLSCNETEPPPSPSPSPSPIACVGDCNDDGAVTVGELIAGVNIDLGKAFLDVCPALSCETGPRVYIDCLVLAVYNALYGCPASARATATVTPSFTPTATALVEPTVTPTTGTGFAVDGCVDEFPGEGCGQFGVTVRLDPLGLTGGTYSDLDFHFGNIPPGSYVLSVFQRCNPWGCWPDEPVTITDHDVFVHIPLIPYTSTPLARTPTPIP